VSGSWPNNTHRLWSRGLLYEKLSGSKFETVKGEENVFRVAMSTSLEIPTSSNTMYKHHVWYRVTSECGVVWTSDAAGQLVLVLHILDIIT